MEIPDTNFWCSKLTLISILFHKLKNKGSNEYSTPYLFNSLLYIFLVFFTSLMKIYALKSHNLNTLHCTFIIHCAHHYQPRQLLHREIKSEYGDPPRENVR